MTHTSATEVADYLVWLAAHECESDPDFLTPLKLQKLLYYAQGWALAEWGTALFRERIEAWRDGPVVPEVFRKYKGKRPIEPELDSGAPGGLTEHERSLVRSVWDAYKQYSAFALRDLTHAERAWASRYVPADAEGRCENEIDVESIRREFVGRVQRTGERLKANRSRLQAIAEANTRALTGRNAI